MKILTDIRNFYFVISSYLKSTRHFLLLTNKVQTKFQTRPEIIFEVENKSVFYYKKMCLDTQ